MDFWNTHQRPQKLLNRQVNKLFHQRPNRKTRKPDVWDVEPQNQTASHQVPSFAQPIIIAPSLSQLPGLVSLLNGPALSTTQHQFQLPTTSFKRNDNQYNRQTTFNPEFNQYNTDKQVRNKFNGKNIKDLREQLQIQGNKQQNFYHKRNTELRRYTLDHKFKYEGKKYVKKQTSSDFTNLSFDNADNKKERTYETSSIREVKQLDVTALRRLAHDRANTFQWYIVPDAEVLMNHIELVNDIVKADEQCMMLVPQPVMTELNMLQQSGNPIAANKSASAWTSVYNHLSNGQAVIGKCPTDHTDSKIDNLFKHCEKMRTQNNHVILVSNETLLESHENPSSIQVFNIKQLMNKLLPKPLDDVKFVVTNENSFARRRKSVDASVQSDSSNSNKTKKIENTKTTCDSAMQTDDKDLDEISFTESTNSVAKSCDTNNSFTVTSTAHPTVKKNCTTAIQTYNRNVDRENVVCNIKSNDTADSGHADSSQNYVTVEKNPPVQNSDMQVSTSKKKIRLIRSAKVKANTALDNKPAIKKPILKRGSRKKSDNPLIIHHKENSNTSNLSSIENENLKTVALNNIVESSYKDSGLNLKIFEMTDKMKENFEVKSDELLSRFIQIMEEALTQVLREEPEYLSEDMPPPWTLIEAVKCIKSKYFANREIVIVSDTLLDILLASSEGGIINTNIGPDQYSNIYSHAVNLIQVLNSTTCLQDLETAANSLSKIWDDVQNTNLDATQNSMFSEVCVEYMPESTYKDKQNDFQVSNEQDVISTRDLSKPDKEYPKNNNIKKISTRCRKICSPRVSTTIDCTSENFTEATFLLQQNSQQPFNRIMSKLNLPPPKNDNKLNQTQVNLICFNNDSNLINNSDVQTNTEDISHNIVGDGVNLQIEDKTGDASEKICKKEPRFLFKFIKNEMYEEILKKEKDNSCESFVQELEDESNSVNNEVEDYDETLKKILERKFKSASISVANQYIEHFTDINDGDKNSYESDHESGCISSLINGNADDCAGRKQQNQGNETEISLLHLSNNCNKGKKDSPNKWNCITNNSNGEACEGKQMNNYDLNKNKGLDMNILPNSANCSMDEETLTKNNDMLLRHLEREAVLSSNSVNRDGDNSTYQEREGDVRNNGLEQKSLVSYSVYSDSDDEDESDKRLSNDYPEIYENSELENKDLKEGEVKKNVNNNLISNYVFICKDDGSDLEKRFLGFEATNSIVGNDGSLEEHIENNLYNSEDITYSLEDYNNVLENYCDIQKNIESNNNDFETDDLLLIMSMALKKINNVLIGNKTYCNKICKMFQSSYPNFIQKSKFHKEILTRIDSLNQLDISLYSLYHWESQQKNKMQSFIDCTGVRAFASLDGKTVGYRDLIAHYMDQLKTMTEALKIILEVTRN